MTNDGSEFLHFRGLNASIFVTFFSIWVRFLLEFHFFALERSIMQSKGRKARTTASRTVCMNTVRIGGHSRRITWEIIPV